MKSETQFIRCPKCYHLNIADTDFITITCSECSEVFINNKTTMNILEALWEA